MISGYIAVTHIDNSKSNVVFMRNLLRVFLPPVKKKLLNYLDGPIQKNLRSPKLCGMYLAFIQFNN